MTVPSYPWYEVAEDEQLLQGDLLERCEVFIPVAVGPAHDHWWC
jgi:hypothetical protein